MQVPVIRWRSLSTRLTLVNLLILVLSLWGLVTFAVRVLHEDMERLIGEQQMSAITLMASEIDNDLQLRMDALALLASSMEAGDFRQLVSLQTTLERHTEMLRLFNYGIFVTDVHAITVASVPISIGRMGTDYSDRDYLQSALREGKIAIGKPVIGKNTKAAILAIAAPIRNAQGIVIGAVVGVIDLGASNFLDRIAAHGYGKTGGYVLVDRKSRVVITATDKRRIMEPLPPPGVNALMDHHMDGEEGVDVAVNPKGIEVISAAKGIPAAMWYVLAALPTAEAFLPIRDLEQRIFLGAIAATLVAGFLIWFLLGRQLAPLVNATRQLKRELNSGGTLQPLGIVSKDEIGFLLGTFNQVLQDLQLREQEVRQLALFDQLTSLPNRRLFFDRLRHALDGNLRTGHHAAVMFLDMDQFKRLNDRHGHSAGDALLVEIARRIKACVRNTDTVARFGGDEFVFLLTELDHDRSTAAAHAENVAEIIRLTLSEHYTLRTPDMGESSRPIEFDSSASIGVCVFSGHEATQDDYLKWADDAMYQAKESGRNAIRLCRCLQEDSPV